MPGIQDDQRFVSEFEIGGSIDILHTPSRDVETVQHAIDKIKAHGCEGYQTTACRREFQLPEPPD